MEVRIGDGLLRGLGRALGLGAWWLGWAEIGPLTARRRGRLNGLLLHVVRLSQQLERKGKGRGGLQRPSNAHNTKSHRQATARREDGRTARGTSTHARAVWT